MNISAQHKNARMAPRKVQLLRSVIRGLPVAQAEAQLQFLPGKASGIVHKVLKSAVANAVHNHAYDPASLVVRDVIVDSGLKMKRWNPVSRGMAHPITKRTSHITVIVGSDISPNAEESMPKGKKKDDSAKIETITAAEHVRRAADESLEEDKDLEKAPARTGLEKPKQSKQEIATGKKVAGQQGGDKAKTHRRKSMSDS